MAQDAESLRLGGWLRRLNYTPIRDLLRGKITGRYDFYSHFRAAFPEPLARHLYKIVNRADLTRREQTQLTQELIERYEPEIAAGKTPEALIEELPRRKTTRRYRRAYKRRRHILWRATEHAAGCLLLVPIALAGMYFWAVVFFWFSKPTLSVDYLAQLNAPALAVPEEDRAWPLYREAYLGMHEYDEAYPKPDYDGVSPYQPHWMGMVTFLEDHQAELALIREAAQKPGLGLTVGYLGHYRDEDALVFYGRSEIDPNLPADRYVVDKRDRLKPMAYWMELANFWPIRHLAQVLVSDAYLAIESHDPERFCDDLEAMFGMVKHLTEVPMHYNGLLGIEIREEVYGVISDVMATNPSVLHESQLKRLLQLINQDAEHQLVTVEGDRLMILDYMQRIYTDNGRGDGHITPEGICLLDSDWDWEPTYTYTWVDRLGHASKVPIEAVLVVSRKEINHKIEDLFDTAESALYVPMWQMHESDVKREIWNWSRSDWRRYRPLHLIGDYTRARESITLCTAKYEGIKTAIAIEQYRRDHGVWPDSLGELLGEYLDHLPVDPMTGEPARYRVIDDRPVIYAVGEDGDDDQAHLPFNLHWRSVENNYAEGWGTKFFPADGDWIIYPDPETDRITQREADQPDIPEPSHPDELGMMGYGYRGPSWYDWPDTIEAVESDDPAP